MEKGIVIKIGGSTLGSHDTTIEDVVALQQREQQLVVVHGGGKLITEWLDKMAIPSRFVRGERATDEAALEVVVAVLAGLVNTEIVATINSLGGRAVGISGVDGALVQSEVKSKELGRVGVVTRVDLSLLETLLEAGYVPVVAPTGLFSGNEVDQSSNILNINADVVAGELAVAVAAERLIFLTDVVGICDRWGELIPQLSAAAAEDLIAAGVASGGMIPKIRACLRAATAITNSYIIDGRQPHALTKLVEEGAGGTTIKGGQDD